MWSRSWKGSGYFRFGGPSSTPPDRPLTSLATTHPDAPCVSGRTCAAQRFLAIENCVTMRDNPFMPLCGTYSSNLARQSQPLATHFTCVGYVFQLLTRGR